MLKKFNNYLNKICISTINTTNLENELTIYVPINKLLPILTILKYHTHFQFTLLTDICALDYPTRSNRFSVIYNLLSLRFNYRLRLKVLTNELDGIPSITSVHPSANWYEREIWDMFGIYFVNHPDLRRILSDYGFEGHPLRKDFPLTGFIEVRYCEQKKRVVYEKISISQEARAFKFHTPWKN